MLPWGFFPPEEWKLWFLLLKLWDICIPVLCPLALSSVAFFIAGILLSLVNRCEPSSHGSPSWVRNITMLSVRAKRLSRILIMFFALGSSVRSSVLTLDSSEVLSFSLSLSLLFWVSISWESSVNEERGLTSRTSASLHLFSVLLFILLVVCLYRVESSSVGCRSRCRFRELYYVGTCEEVGDSLGSVFFEAFPLRGRTGIGFLENASAFTLIFPAL